MTMIRLFTALCKSVLEKLSDEAIFQEATDGYSYHKAQCPACGTVGKLSPYGDYSRNLVSHDGEESIESSISPRRFECGSCGRTHALLPDILVPHSQYSLRFMLTALVAYFDRSKTIVALCAQFGIAVSTLYAWKHRLLEHKELLLGMVYSHNKPAHAFLRGLLASIHISEQLSYFFNRYAFSFLQNRPQPATRSRSP